MELKQLLNGLSYTVLQGSEEVHVDKVVYDNRMVEDNCLFVCIKGMKYDTHDHVEEIADKGAKVILV